MEKNLHFSSIPELESFLEQLPLISVGSESTCYRYSGNQVIRYLDGPAYQEYPKEHFLHLMDIDKSSYVFINGLIYVKENIVACLMPYAKGNKLAFMDMSTFPLDSLLESLPIVEEDTKRLSKKGLLKTDFATDNILIDTTGIAIIDPLDYQVVDYPENVINFGNMAYFSTALYEQCIDKNKSITKFVNSKGKLKGYGEKNEYLEHPTMYLKMLRNELSEYCGFEIDTLQEAQNVLQKRKK